MSWQQGPLSAQRTGTFLTAEPVPERLLYAEPLRRRRRVAFGGQTLVDTEDVVVLHEPGRYPVAWFPAAAAGALTTTPRTTPHRALGRLRWMDVALGDRGAARAAWRLEEPPAYAALLADRVAFSWPAMDAFYEEDERVLSHAADAYHGSTSAAPAVTSSSATATRWSRTPTRRSCSTSPASPRAGTCPRPTSTPVC